MPQKKDHHFVPQFYLRNFGSGNSIPLFNLNKNIYVPEASIPGQCQKPYLYTRDIRFEENFEKADTEFSKIIQKIIRTSSLPRSWSEEHHSLMRFVIVQKERTPAAGRETQERMITIGDFVMKNNPPPPDLDVRKVKLEWINPILFNMQMMEKMAPTLMDLSMKILINETNTEFITSDSPLAIINQWTMGSAEDGGTALACSGLQIFLPINPKLLILFYDRQIYNVGRQGSESVKIVRTDDVNSINGLQLLSAENNLYGKVREVDIAKLPLHWRKLKSVKFKTLRVVYLDGEKDVYQYRPQPNTNLNLSFVRLVSEMKKVPLGVRRKYHRKLSSMIQQKISKANDINFDPGAIAKEYITLEEK